MEIRKLCYWCAKRFEDAGFRLDVRGGDENGKCEHCRKKRQVTAYEIGMQKGVKA